MNILFILDHPKSAGGGHVQGLNYFTDFIKILNGIGIKNYYYLNDTSLSGNALEIEGAKPITAKILNLRLKILNIFLEFLPIGVTNILAKKLHLNLEKKLQKFQIDLVIFLGPSRLLAMVGDKNFLISSWDLSHREDCEFPEVRDSRTYFKREFWIKNYYPRAMGIIVDSPESARQLSSWYGIEKDRIFIIPFSPNPKAVKEDSKVSRTGQRNRKNKVARLILPAQLWPHKGHVWLLESMRRLIENEKLNIELLIIGGDRLNMSIALEKLVFDFGLDNKVNFKGFISDQELNNFYQESDVLVFPSFFGPTNLPPLEAAAHGLSVVLAGKKSFREFYPEPFIFFDIEQPSSLDSAIKLAISRKFSNDYSGFFSNLDQMRNGNLKKLQFALRQFEQKQKLWRL